MSQSLSSTLYSIGESGRVKVNLIMRTLTKAKTADLQLILQVRPSECLEKPVVVPNNQDGGYALLMN